jgi:hypothetical protein
MFTKKPSINKNIIQIIGITAVLVNFSLIPNSKLSILHFGLIYLLYAAIYYIKNFEFKKIDFLILIFFSFSIISNLLNQEIYPYETKNFTQSIYILLIGAYIYIFRNLISANFINKNRLLQYILIGLTILNIISIFLYFIGIVAPTIVRITTGVMNNANIYNIGGIITSFGPWGPPRLCYFGPEPSFWGGLTAIILLIKPPIYSGLLKRKYFYTINILALTLTFSRTAFLIIAVGMIYLILRKNLTKVILTMLAPALLIITCTFILSFNTNSLLDFDLSFKQRFGSVFTAFELFQKNPVIGIGTGNFYFYAIRMGLDYKDIFNLYLSILTTNGIIGLITFTTIIYEVNKRIRSNQRQVIIGILVFWFTVSTFNLLILWIILLCIANHSPLRTKSMNNGTKTE